MSQVIELSILKTKCSQMELVNDTFSESRKSIFPCYVDNPSYWIFIPLLHFLSPVQDFPNLPEVLLQANWKFKF